MQGNQGGAVLRGILDAAFSGKNTSSDVCQSRPVSRFIATTKSAVSAEQLRESLAKYKAIVDVVSSQNVQAMQNADVVILGIKPFMAEEILSAPGVREALAGKLVITMLAGQTTTNLANIIREGTSGDMADPIVMKASPNMGAQFCQSATVIETPDKSVPAHMIEIAEWIFKQVGEIKYLPPSLIDMGTMVAGATLATMTIPIEGLLDGCVAGGFKRSDAMDIVLHAIRGMSAVLESGIHPAVLRESSSSPGGCTIHSLMTLERAGSRADFADALINGTRHVQGVNK